MQLSVITESDLIITIECASEDTAAVLKARVAAQTGLREERQILLFQGRAIGDNETVAGIGALDGDVLMLQEAPAAAPSGGRMSDAFGRLSAQDFMDNVRRNPQLLGQLAAGNPELAEAIRSNDASRVEAIVTQAREREARRQQDLAQLYLNPMDVESQRKIEELIQQKNIEENFHQAIEHTPEIFGSVTMLYVNMEVNGIPVQAFVDTGAQMTIMNQNFAEKCSLTRLIDKRFSGMAFGVGQSKIVGQIHQAPLKVAGEYIASSLIVLEQDRGPPFIFGLNNLIRHQCMVDLKAMKLIIGSINVEVPFLVEHEINKADEGLPGSGKDSSPALPNQQSNTPAAPVSEEKIQRLMALGFERQACIQALQAANGNEEIAVDFLFH